MIKIKEMISRYPFKTSAKKAEHETSRILAQAKPEHRTLCNQDEMIGILEEAEIIGC